MRDDDYGVGVGVVLAQETPTCRSRHHHGRRRSLEQLFHDRALTHSRMLQDRVRDYNNGNPHPSDEIDHCVTVGSRVDPVLVLHHHDVTVIERRRRHRKFTRRTFTELSDHVMGAALRRSSIHPTNHHPMRAQRLHQRVIERRQPARDRRQRRHRTDHQIDWIGWINGCHDRCYPPPPPRSRILNQVRPLRNQVRPLRVAVLSPIAWRTPPRAYGPWEQFASTLADGLVRHGCDVTLFATGDSTTTARLRSVVARGWEEDPTLEAKPAECLHVAAVFERADDFDIIHNSFDFVPLMFSHLVETPVVTTIHGFSSEAVAQVYRRFDLHNHYVAISKADRRADLTYAATIHHGIELEVARDARPTHRGPLLFFGRIHPDKGTATAIEVANRAGRRLLIAGIVHDHDYFDDEVRPHLDGDRVRYLGAVDRDRRSAVLSSASALLHLIDFEEPFGYSVAESLVCGTPVVAFERGSMPELIHHGVDGFVVDDIDAAVAAVAACDELDRAAISERARRRFDAERMIGAYLDVYDTCSRRDPHRSSRTRD